MEISGLPETVTEVYKSTNDVGYVFMLTCDGYGGKDTMNLICGIDNDGFIAVSYTHLDVYKRQVLHCDEYAWGHL